MDYTTGVQAFAELLAVAAASALLGTLVTAYRYILRYFRLAEQGLEVVNWHGLTAQNDAVTAWHQVEDVDYKRGGIFSLIFGYGTLLIQTAGRSATRESRWCRTSSAGATTSPSVPMTHW